MLGQVGRGKKRAPWRPQGHCCGMCGAFRNPAVPATNGIQALSWGACGQSGHQFGSSANTGSEGAHWRNQNTPQKEQGCRCGSVVSQHHTRPDPMARPAAHTQAPAFGVERRPTRIISGWCFAVDQTRFAARSTYPQGILPELSPRQKSDRAGQGYL